MLDKAAFILACKMLHVPLVTTSVGKINFLVFASAGYLTDTLGRVIKIEQRSVAIEINLVAENILGGQRTMRLAERS